MAVPMRTRVAPSRIARAKGPKLHHGKQSLKQLKAHGAALTNIEVTEANIGAFKPCAKKYSRYYCILYN